MTVVTTSRPPLARGSHAPLGRSESLRGTGALVRLALRRDRVLLPSWILGFAAMVTFSVVATKDLYPSTADISSAADVINATAALVALYGKVYAVDSLGAVSLIKMTAFGAALVAVLFVFLVVRHTRADEEAG
jgi:ABC-2 type transport system permease protein